MLRRHPALELVVLDAVDGLLVLVAEVAEREAEVEVVLLEEDRRRALGQLLRMDQTAGVLTRMLSAPAPSDSSAMAWPAAKA